MFILQFRPYNGVLCRGYRGLNGGRWRGGDPICQLFAAVCLGGPTLKFAVWVTRPLGAKGLCPSIRAWWQRP